MFKIIFILSFLISTASCTKLSRFSKKDLHEIKTITIGKQNTEHTRILFLGDLDFGESYQNEYSENVLQQHGYLYSFSAILNLIKSADYCIANLETPLFPFDSIYAVDIEKPYLHYSDTLLAPVSIKKAGINAVSLANNHSMDFGKTGLNLTTKLLQKHKIEILGAGKNHAMAALPLKLNIISNKHKTNLYILGAQRFDKTYANDYRFYATKKTEGINLLSVFNIASEIRLIKKYDSRAVVILFPHWASNYKWKGIKQNLFSRVFVLAGADLILGHGAHCTQEIETIFGKPVFFSIGNSVFNSMGRFDEFKAIKYSLLVQLEIENNHNHFNIKGYPILSDNKITKFQPRFLNHTEFTDFLETINNQSSGNIFYSYSIGKDGIGNYISCVLN